MQNQQYNKVRKPTIDNPKFFADIYIYKQAHQNSAAPAARLFADRIIADR